MKPLTLTGRYTGQDGEPHRTISFGIVSTAEDGPKHILVVTIDGRTFIAHHGDRAMEGYALTNKEAFRDWKHGR
jgi:hypothetical protein